MTCDRVQAIERHCPASETTVASLVLAKGNLQVVDSSETEMLKYYGGRLDGGCTVSLQPDHGQDQSYDCSGSGIAVESAVPHETLHDDARC